MAANWGGKLEDGDGELGDLEDGVHTLGGLEDGVHILGELLPLPGLIPDLGDGALNSGALLLPFPGPLLGLVAGAMLLSLPGPLHGVSGGAALLLPLLVLSLALVMVSSVLPSSPPPWLSPCPCWRRPRCTAPPLGP